MAKKYQSPPPSTCVEKIGSPHPNTPKSLVPPSNLPTPQAINNELSLNYGDFLGTFHMSGNCLALAIPVPLQELKKKQV